MKAILVIVALFALAYAQIPQGIDIIDFSQDNYTKGVMAYWTPERMKNAIPYKWFLNRKPNSTWSDLEAPVSTEYVPDQNYQTIPYKAVGKVFFTSQGANYVCSGSISGNNAVLTAGHCVSNGRNKWHTNWMFVPQYNNGRRPYGGWVASKLIAFSAWHRSEDLARDVAFAITKPNNGRSVEQTVGAALGFKRGIGRGENVIAIGYPVPRYGGERMVRTSASVSRSEGFFRPPTVGILSSMEGGCSGGPWVCDGGRNACGLNSYGYPGRGDLYSPGFDPDVQAVREYAISQ